MITASELISEKKVEYIAREIIMGTRTKFDFNCLFASPSKLGGKTRLLQDISRNNYHSYAHYFIELGYLNTFNQDETVGKKLRDWYEKQMLYTHNQGYIQLFCILFARSTPIFERYGQSDKVTVNYFDVITGNFEENRNRQWFCNRQYTYNALSLYSDMVCEVIRLCKTITVDVAQTNPRYKNWLDNELNFIENIKLVDKINNNKYRSGSVIDGESYIMNMLKSIKKASSLFEKDATDSSVV